MTFAAAPEEGARLVYDQLWFDGSATGSELGILFSFRVCFS